MGRDVAITSPQAGTTRDIVEAQAVIAGLPVTFSDTAGLRESQDAIEAEGVRRARARAKDAHLVIHVVRGKSGGEALASDILFRNLEGSDVAESQKEIQGNALSGLGIDLILKDLERQILEKYARPHPHSPRRLHSLCATIGRVCTS